MLSSTSFEMFHLILSHQDNNQSNDNSIVQMKMEVMKCLVYITIGAKYLASLRGL